MTDLAITDHLPSTSDQMIERIRQFELNVVSDVEFATEHLFHAGMYARTVRIPAGVVFTSVVVKIPTVLVVCGEMMVLSDETWMPMRGFKVLSAEANRKQVYATLSAVEITMVFRSNAGTVEQAEAEFTDETESLLSRGLRNDIVRTEEACLESQPRPRS